MERLSFTRKIRSTIVRGYSALGDWRGFKRRSGRGGLIRATDLGTRVLHPTGKSVRTRSPSNFCLSSPFCKNISVYPKSKSGYDLPSRPLERGVGHRHERWDGE